MIAGYDVHRRAVDEELRAVFEGRQGFLYDVLQYHLGWVDQQGMPLDAAPELHFQSRLALLSCEAVSGDFRPALPAAAAVELVYNFTLVHGDVQSNRSGSIPGSEDRPSIWWVWGPAQAINAGDGLHALGRTTIMRLAQREVPPERILSAMQSLDRACLITCEGQYIDLEFRDRLTVSSHAYLDMAGRKTGALASCAAELGALAGGASEQVCAAFSGMGSRFGVAWQIIEDISELWGERGDGMTAANVLNKKKSLPLVYVLEMAPVSAKRELGAVYMKRVLQPEDVARLVEILDSVDARSFAQGKARALADEGLASLDNAGLPEERIEPLREFSEWVLAENVPPNAV